MVGAQDCIATKIKQLELKAFIAHCYVYTLNLSVIHTIKQSNTIKDCLDICHELFKPIKVSPKCHE